MITQEQLKETEERKLALRRYLRHRFEENRGRRGRVAYPCARFLGRPKKGGSTDEESKSLTFLDR